MKRKYENESAYRQKFTLTSLYGNKKCNTKTLLSYSYDLSIMFLIHIFRGVEYTVNRD